MNGVATRAPALLASPSLRAIALGCALLALGCSDAIAPSSERARASDSRGVCSPSCVIFEGDLAELDYPAGGQKLLARAVLRGEGRHEAVLRASSWVADSPSAIESAPFRVLVGTDTSAFSLEQMIAGVHLSASVTNADSLVVVVEILGEPATGHLVLELAPLLDPVQVVAWQPLRKATDSGPLAHANSMSMICMFAAPSSTCGDVTATVSPSYPGPYEPGTFATVFCCIVSVPGTLTFSEPVSNVSITVFDPDFPGNEIVANTTAGSTSYPIQGDNQPGTLTEQTVLISSSGITSLSLIPAPQDYVAYGRVSFMIGASIEVECLPANPTRGTQLSCSASLPAGQAGTLAISEWHFSSSGTPSFAVGETTTATTWSGIIVASGQVEALGTVDGESASGTATVAVQARDWTQKQVNFVVQEVSSNLPTRPKAPADLGNHSGFVEAYIPTGGFQQVAGGPNADVIYFTEVPVTALSQIQINRTALSVGSDFYNLQRKNGGPAGSCTQADVVPFIALAEDHEGLTLSPASHAGVLKNELNAAVPQASEPAHALGDLAGAVDMAAALTAAPVAAAKLASMDAINGGTVPAIPYCSFRWFR